MRVLQNAGCWPLSMLSLITLTALGLCTAAEAGEPPPVRVIYFVPSDRQPLKNHVERIDRVMTEVQGFYRNGMAAAGYGALTFALERDEQRQLRVHLVNGQQPMQVYGRNASDAVRREVKAALAPRGINIDQETIIIFQVLLKWEDGKAAEIGPYCGAGDHRHGTAWVYDDELLDAALLGSQAPGGYYGTACSIGEFNSHYVGGVAHEFGHAFGLPHDCQKETERGRGHSLMGGGNHTYGQEKRKEGPGTFLSEASAMLLAFSRPFAGNVKDAAQRPSCRLNDLDAQFAEGKIALTGALAADPPAFGIAAFDDWEKIEADYDAVSWTCKVSEDGRFRLEVGEMRPGRSQLRLRVCHVNGTSSVFAFDYGVDSSKKPNLDVFRYQLPLSEATAAYLAGDRQKVDELSALLRQRFPEAGEVERKVRHLQALLRPAAPRLLSELKADDKSVQVSQLQFRAASVGWGQPLRDQALVEEPRDCFLQVGGRFYESGMFAHAPSRYELSLSRAWKQLCGSYGLQDGHPGSVVFVIKVDGRELLRSKLVKDHLVRDFELEVAGVERLELIVEDGGDGANSDWGVWLAPQLKR